MSDSDVESADPSAEESEEESSDEVQVIETESEEESEDDAEYQSQVEPAPKRARKLSPPKDWDNWCRDRPWLQIEESDGKLQSFCSWCRDHGRKAGGNLRGAWIDGTTRITFDGVRVSFTMVYLLAVVAGC